MEEAYFPGYNEDVHMEEYEQIRKHINEKFDTKSSAMQVRAEFEIAFNKLFDSMMEDYSDRVFDVLYVMMESFNINEIKAYRYLNKDNKEKVRNFAINRKNAYYYEKKEKEMIKKKMKKKGKPFYEFQDVRGLFE